MSEKKSSKNDNDASFQIMCSSTPITQLNEEFQDTEFEAAGSKLLSKSRAPRPKSALMALPEGSEGYWGRVSHKSTYFQYLEFDRKYIVAGNWKSDEDWEFINCFPTEGNEVCFDDSKVEVLAASSNKYLAFVNDLLTGGQIQPMAQDVSTQDAAQLTDEGIKWSLVGHSSKRKYVNEQSDEEVALKTKVALENGMNVMVCIGESIDEKEDGKTGKVTARQLQAVVDQITESQWGNVVIVYEPVWARGYWDWQSRHVRPEEAQNTHAEIRNWLADAVSPAVAGATRILYGG